MVSATRSSSMKPVILPMLRNLLALGGAGGLGGRLHDMHLAKRPLVFVRKYLDEAASHRIPMVEHRQCTRAARETQVALDPGPKHRFVQFAQMPQAPLSGSDQLSLEARLFCAGKHRLQAHHRQVTAPRECAVFVVDVRNPSAHACREIAPGTSKHAHAPPRHIFPPPPPGTPPHPPPA